MLEAMWTWISKERTRKTLAWIGGAVVIVASALWKVYTYQPPAQAPAVLDASAKHADPAQDIKPGQEAKAESGGIAINAADNARVIVKQSKR